MKLDCGQRIAPVPWPIQNSPMASARKPIIESDLAMDFPRLPLSVLLDAAACDGCRRKPLPAASRIYRSNTMPAGSARPEVTPGYRGRRLSGILWAAGRSFSFWRTGLSRDRIAIAACLSAVQGRRGRRLTASAGRRIAAGFDSPRHKKAPDDAGAFELL